MCGRNWGYLQTYFENHVISKKTFIYFYLETSQAAKDLNLVGQLHISEILLSMCTCIFSEVLECAGLSIKLDLTLINTRKNV